MNCSKTGRYSLLWAEILRGQRKQKGSSLAEELCFFLLLFRDPISLTGRWGKRKKTDRRDFSCLQMSKGLFGELGESFLGCFLLGFFLGGALSDTHADIVQEHAHGKGRRVGRTGFFQQTVLDGLAVVRLNIFLQLGLVVGDIFRLFGLDQRLQYSSRMDAAAS